MFDPKIKISKALHDKIRVAAEIMGCASVEEFVEKVLSTEADRVINQTGKKEVSEKEVQEIANQLKGLGYLE
jgi:hypothetical protein